MPASRRSRRRANCRSTRAASLERKLFDEQVGSEEAKALRYAFFAEREVAKIPFIPADTKLRPTDHPAVVGAGTMGGGIAMSFADNGYDVKITDATQGSARPRHGADQGQLRDQRQTRLPGARRVRAPLRAHPPGAEHRRPRRLRRGHRGGVRADRRQGGRVEKARRGDAAGGAALHQHLGHRHRHHGQRDQAAAGRRRHAFLRARPTS